MDNENQTTTPAQQKPHRVVRNSLIVLAMLVFTAAGYMSYRNPTLFTAAITGGADASVDTDLYISTDYKSNAGESDYISIKAGKAMTNLSALRVTFTAPSSMVDMVSISKDGMVLQGASFTTSTPGTGQFSVIFTIPSPIATVSDNAVLFKMLVSLKSTLNQGDTVVISRVDNSVNSRITENAITRVPTFTDGKITIGTTEDVCKTKNCGEHAACDQTTGNCVCFKGYDQTYLCNACSSGYTGYPDCKVDVLSNVTGIVLTFSKDTISKLTMPDRVQAYSSAYVLINSSAAASTAAIVGPPLIPAKTNTITVDGQPVNLESSPAGANEKAKVIDLADDLATKLEGLVIDINPDPGITTNVRIVNVLKYPNIPGLLKLTATVDNPDGSLDGITTNSGEIIIVPGLEKKIVLNPAASYQLRVIGKNNIDTDVSALDINFNNLKWQPQPVNRLDSSALAGGLLEKGDKSGVTPLYAQVEKANGSKIDSNQITVEVPSGPIVEYIHIVGSDPIVRSGRILLSTKISDVDQISDIKDIMTSIVRSTQTTYAGIQGDASAVWFTATPVITEVAATENGTQETPAEGEEEPPATPVTENYRIYSIPVEVPQDENMTDGPYKLILELTDNAGHVASSVLPINIGAVATGDVDGNGKVNMLDIIAAFQIANGTNTTPTQSQLQAADLDKNGKVTMLDVITLFNQLK